MRKIRVPDLEDINTSRAQRTELRRLGAGNWAIVGVLGTVLALAAGFAIYAWRDMGGVEISKSGWIAMAIGIVFTTIIGCGLMALVFYSSRRDYDR